MERCSKRKKDFSSKEKKNRFLNKEFNKIIAPRKESSDNIMKIGKYHIAPRSSQILWKDDPQKRARKLLNGLDRVSELFENSQWEITGGVAVSLNLGRFYRTHVDVDIGVNEDCLPLVFQKAQSMGYGFFQRHRIFSYNHNGIEAYKMIHPGDLGKRYSRLSLFKIKDEKISLDYPYVDVFPYHKDRTERPVWNNKFSKIPIEDAPVDVKFEGRKFPITSSKHLAQLLISGTQSGKRDRDILVLSNLQ